jgi:hypothetical protein
MHQPGQVLLRQHGDRASHVHEDEPSFQHTAQITSNRMREGGCQRRDRAHEDRGGRAGHGVLHWRNHCAAHRQCASPAIGQCADGRPGSLRWRGGCEAGSVRAGRRADRHAAETQVAPQPGLRERGWGEAAGQRGGEAGFPRTRPRARGLSCGGIAHAGEPSPHGWGEAAPRGLFVEHRDGTGRTASLCASSRPV